MKTKIPIAAVLTDTHLKPENIKVNISVYEQACAIAANYGLDTVYHGGDIFESRKGQTEDVLNAFKEILDLFRRRKMELFAIPGNHDKTDYGAIRSFLHPFMDHPSFSLVDTYAGVGLTKDVALHMMPFFNDDKYIAEFKPVFQKGKNVLLTHIGLDGAIMNNGTTVKSKITKDLFAGFDKIMIGHYHDSDNEWYIGSSIQHNFGETPNKGLTVLYDDLSHETIPLDFPKFLTFQVDVKDMTLKDVNDFKKEKEETGNNYRIVLTGDTAKIKAYDKHAMEEAGIKITTKEDKIVEEEITTRLTAFTDVALLETFQQFCDKNKLDHKTGLAYLEKTLSK